MFEDALVRLIGRPSGNDLADELDLDSGQDARAAATMAIPVIVANMARVAEQPVGAIGLLRMTLAQGLRDRDPAGQLWRDPKSVDIDIVRALLGSRADIVVTAVAQRVGVNTANAEKLLAKALIACMSVLALKCGPAANRTQLQRLLVDERNELLREGWQTWINATVGTGDQSKVLELARSVSLKPQPPVQDLAHPRPTQPAALNRHHRSGRKPRLLWLSIAVGLTTVAVAALVLAAL